MHLLHKVQHLLTSFWPHLSPETSSKGGQLDTIASVLLPSAQACKELKTPANRKSGRILGFAFLNSRASLWPCWCCRPRPAPKDTPWLLDSQLFICTLGNGYLKTFAPSFPGIFSQVSLFICAPQILGVTDPHISGPLDHCIMISHEMYYVNYNSGLN